MAKTLLAAGALATLAWCAALIYGTASLLIG
jgi:hypothetical protein